MAGKLAKASIHPKDGRAILMFESQPAFRKWLARNCETCAGIWIKFAKKGSGVDSVVYPEALEVALCYGWIDSQVLSLDERFYLQRFTPRGPRSKWSKINCGKVAKLIESGQMTPRGMKEVEAAKKDGRWERAYDGQKEMLVPADFQKELDKSSKAARYFTTLNARNRFAILYQIHDAKKPETRRRRIEKFMKLLRAGEKIY